MKRNAQRTLVQLFGIWERNLSLAVESIQVKRMVAEGCVDTSIKQVPRQFIPAWNPNAVCEVRMRARTLRIDW